MVKLNDVVYYVPDPNSVIDYQTDFVIKGRIVAIENKDTQRADEKDSVECTYFMEPEDTFDCFRGPAVFFYTDKKEAHKAAEKKCEAVIKRLEEKLNYFYESLKAIRKKK